jgi:hypothetical protein
MSSPLALQSFLDNAFILLASIMKHKHTKQTNNQAKNNAPIKRKDLIERAKG